MLRVVVAVSAAVLFVAGCASDREAAPPVQTKIVKVEKMRTCTTTFKPDPSFCERRVNCPEIKTCAEAYYRYTTCRHLWLDGGVAPREGGEPDGIPCERGEPGGPKYKCGPNALAMANAIRAQPFTPPTRSEAFCGPAA
jgi:hypothetical protein